MLLVKLCPNGIKFRAQTTKQSTLDPIFDKKFSFSVRPSCSNCRISSSKIFSGMKNRKEFKLTY